MNAYSEELYLLCTLLVWYIKRAFGTVSKQTTTLFLSNLDLPDYFRKILPLAQLPIS